MVESYQEADFDQEVDVVHEAKVGQQVEEDYQSCGELSDEVFDQSQKDILSSNRIPHIFEAKNDDNMLNYNKEEELLKSRRMDITQESANASDEETKELGSLLPL